ncbi:MAG: heparinase II/III family protein [Kiritimatiellae bacterium]|nr:heparinase II/III family protein [Kiritimatiellia bacterium]
MKNLNSFMSGKSVGLFSMAAMWAVIPLAVNVAFSAPNNGDAWIARIRTDHPRMFFNAETWPAVKARAEGPARAARDNLLKRADDYPDDPVCSGFDPVTFREVKTASGTHTTTAATPIPSVKEWGPQAAECALAWRFTGERKYLEKARKMLEASVAAYHAAYRNGRAVNWYSTSRILALCAYDWIWEGLTPDERKAIIVPLVKHVEDVQPGKGKPSIIRRNTGGIQTGFYSVPSLLWYSGLASFGDGFCDDLARNHLRRGHDLCTQMLKFRNDGAGDDGALSSAVPGYCMGAYPWAHFNFFHTWLSATGENLAASYPGLALFPNWIYWTWIPNEQNPSVPLYSGFGDDPHTQNALTVGRLYEHMTQYIHFFRDANPAAARLAASLRDRVSNQSFANDWPMYPFLFGGGDDGVKPYSADELENLPLHARHFENLGQFLMRSGWKPDSTYCTFTAGASLTQHKHHDENNFTIYKHDFLSLDSGTRGVETDWNLKYYYAQTIAHNCILIRRPDEPLPRYWGPVYPGPEGKTNDGGMYDGSAKVLAFETNDAYTYIASDATAIYGEKCKEAVRQFVHLLPDVFVVYDRVTAVVPTDRKAWLLHTKDEPRIEGRLLTADSGKGRLFCETVLPEDAALVTIGGPGKEYWANGKNWEPDSAFLASAERGAKRTGRGPYFGAWRLEVSPGAPRDADRFLHVITAADTSVSSAPQTRKVVKGGMDGVIVTLPASSSDTVEVTVLFNREGPVGGMIAIGKNAPLRPFATTIQPQSGIF